MTGPHAIDFFAAEGLRNSGHIRTMLFGFCSAFRLHIFELTVRFRGFWMVPWGPLHGAELSLLGCQLRFDADQAALQSVYLRRELRALGAIAVCRTVHR